MKSARIFFALVFVVAFAAPAMAAPATGRSQRPKRSGDDSSSNASSRLATWVLMSSRSWPLRAWCSAEAWPARALPIRRASMWPRWPARTSGLLSPCVAWKGAWTKVNGLAPQLSPLAESAARMLRASPAQTSAW